MKLIIGLGNPGAEYKSTKHNIGFEVVKAIAKDNKIAVNKKAHFSLSGNGVIGDEEVILALPETYMNLSGKAVGELFRRKALDIKDILIICDDINLELGKIRMRKQGSSGGHKGLSSIIATLGRDDFPRLRVGIATDVHKGDITGYVLSPFKHKARRNVLHSIALARDAVVCMLEEGIDKAMSKFNKKKVGTS
jgi:PTH1 family peptidyl-tRNA hydrolase